MPDPLMTPLFMQKRKFKTTGDGKVFSHAIPDRFWKKSSTDYKPHLDNPLGRALRNSIFNGNIVSPRRHYLHDPHATLRGGPLNGDRFPRAIQILDRVPRTIYAGGASTGSYITGQFVD